MGLRSVEAMRRVAPWSALAGFLATAGAGIVVLLGRTYRAETCWSGPGGSGCRYSNEPFLTMLLRFPEQVAGPIFYVVILTALAAIVAVETRGRSGAAPSPDAALVALALYGLVALGSTVFLGPHFAVPFALLAVAVFPSLPQLALAAAAVVAAYGTGEAVVAAVHGGLCPWSPVSSDLARLYVGYATVVGVATASGAVQLGKRWPLLRGLIVAYAAMGLAGLVALVLVLRTFCVDGHFVNFGMAGMSRALVAIALPNALLGILAIRVGLGLRWQDAFTGTLAAGLGIPAAAAAALLATPLYLPR